MPSLTSDMGRYAVIPEWLLDADVSANAIRLWAVLAAKYADRVTDDCYPGRARLAVDMKKSVDTVDRVIRELVDCGALEVTPRYNDERGDRESNVYRLRFVRTGGRTDAATPLGTDAAETIIISDPDLTHSVADRERERTAERDRIGRMLVDIKLDMSAEPITPWVNDWIVEATEVVTEADVTRIREAIDESRKRGSVSWGYVRSIIARVAADRRAGRDPWYRDVGAGPVRGGWADRGAARGGRVRGAGSARSGADGGEDRPGFDLASWRGPAAGSNNQDV